MSRKSQVKEIKQLLGGSSTSDVNGMFEEMMGLKDAELSIILPKFVKTRNLLRHIYKVLMQFSNFIPLQLDFPDLKEPMEQIKLFANELKTSVVFNETKNNEETQEMYSSVSKEDLNLLYKKLKQNPFVQRLIILCSNLKQYSRYFDDINNLKDNFIGQEPGLSLVIFDFSTFDLKKLWANSKITPMIKKYVLTILHNLYKDIFDLYKITTSPDVDIDKFTEVLLESIGQLRKQPGLHRCNNAFKRIEDSVELLKNKFDNYYRESVASSNPNMIVESFIIDVSNQGGADARLTREFRQIIQYMHTASAKTGKNKDPNVQKLFKMLNQNFELMEKKTGVRPTNLNKTNIDKTNIDNLDLSLKVDNIDEKTKSNLKKKKKKNAKVVSNVDANLNDVPELVDDVPDVAKLVDDVPDVAKLLDDVANLDILIKEKKQN